MQQLSGRAERPVRRPRLALPRRAHRQRRRCFALFVVILVDRRGDRRHRPERRTTGRARSGETCPAGRTWSPTASSSSTTPLFELLRGATPGQDGAGHARDWRDDGRTPPAGAIVLRNLVRIPEVVFYYIPAGISCLASAKNQRLGDLAAHTVVAAPRQRRSCRAAPASGGGAPLAAPPSPAPALAHARRRAGRLVAGRLAHGAQGGRARPAWRSPQLPAPVRARDRARRRRHGGVLARVRRRLAHARRRRHRPAARERPRGGRGAAGRSRSGRDGRAARPAQPLPRARAVLHGGLRRPGARGVSAGGALRDRVGLRHFITSAFGRGAGLRPPTTSVDLPARSRCSGRGKPERDRGDVPAAAHLAERHHADHFGRGTARRAPRSLWATRCR